jgi:hypothetical protein
MANSIAPDMVSMFRTLTFSTRVMIRRPESIPPIGSELSITGNTRSLSRGENKFSIKSDNQIYTWDIKSERENISAGNKMTLSYGKNTDERNMLNAAMALKILISELGVFFLRNALTKTVPSITQSAWIIKRIGRDSMVNCSIKRATRIVPPIIRTI